jgi:hypothetical protein
MLLCMDFSGEKIRLLCAEKKKEKSKVVESLELNLSELGDYLESRSGQINEIRVSGLLENTFHKILSLPDMKSKMVKEAVENEIIKAFGNDYQFKQLDLGEVPGPGNKVNRKIMTVGIKRDNLEELSKLFASYRVKPNIFTTYPVALQTLLEKMELLSEEALAFVEIAHPNSRIVVFQGKEIRVTRELPLAEKEKDPESSALAKDIYRTLLFYTESFPNERVTHLVIAGNSSTSEILESLKQKTGAEITIFSPEHLLEKTENISMIYPGCLGLALLDPGHFRFGFIPLSVEERRKIKKTVTPFSFIFVGILLIFILVIFQLSLNLKSLNLYEGGIKGEIKLKEDRMKELSLELVSHFIETSQPPWSEILLELAAAVPPGVSLKSMSMKRTGKGWMGEVCGIADGSDEITSLVLVEKIQNNFVQSPLFSKTKLVEKKLEGKRVAFKIIYQLEVEV